MLYAIWYHLHYLKYVKNTHGGVLLKVTLLHGCFSCFLNCTNGAKSRKVPHMMDLRASFLVNCSITVVVHILIIALVG